MHIKQPKLTADKLFRARKNVENRLPVQIHGILLFPCGEAGLVRG